MGRVMALFPLDPRLARVILAAQEYQCLYVVLVYFCYLFWKKPRFV